VPKFRLATPANSEVIMVNLYHFKPIFDPPLKKVVRGAPSPVGRALVMSLNQTSTYLFRLMQEKSR